MKVVALDCETVKCHPDEKWLKDAAPKKSKKKDIVHVAAHCAIVDYNGKKIYEKFVRLRSSLKIIDYNRSIQCKHYV